MYLILDTETDGIFFNNKFPLDHYSQGNVIQLAFKLYDENERVVQEYNSLIKPEFFTTIRPEAINIHHITMDRCHKYGIPLKHVFNVFWMAYEHADMIIGHNISFDTKAIACSLARCGAKKETLDDLINKKSRCCTMKTSIDILNLKQSNGAKKRPSLLECYQYFFNKDIENAHDAMADVNACADVFFKLNKIKNLTAA